MVAARRSFAALAPSLRADLRWTASGHAGWAATISRSSLPANWRDSALRESNLAATYARAFATFTVAHCITSARLT